MKMPLSTPENKSSRLLSSEENQQVFKLLGNRCQNTIIAFNFADTNEANDFKSVVDEKITLRKRREEKRARQSREFPNLPNAPNNTIEFRKKNLDPMAKSAKRKRNITKADIGSPLDFKHVSHVGWNPDSGFDIDSEDAQLKSFFEKAGISEKQLQDRDTKVFIYDFISKNGGKEAILQETTNQGGRKSPTVPPPPSSNGVVPPVPPRGSTASRSHVRIAPPPPPPSSMNINQMTKSSYEGRSAGPPPPPSGPGFGPPPPPPPPPIMSPHESISSPPPAPALGSELLESIKSGTTLKHVDVEKLAPVDDSRNDLLSDIRKGTKLRPVCEREVKPISNVAESGTVSLAEVMARGLARALAERNKAIHSEDDDDDDEDSDFNDDEWD